jgi:hypothetical protein
MSERLVVEVAIRRGWNQAGLLHAGDPPGSLSHNPPEGQRQIILFSCHGDHSLIRRSTGGADIELGAGRVVGTLGYEEMAKLRAGEHFECLLLPDKRTRAMRVRFRHEVGP